MTMLLFCKVLVRIAGTIILLSVVSCGSPEEIQPEGPDSITTKAGINGSWSIVYQDIQLGFVKGRAFIDTDAAHAEILLRHPHSGKETHLIAQSIEINGDRVTITWGAEKSENERAFKPFGEAVPTAGLSLVLGLGEAQQKISLEKAVVPSGKIVTDLVYYPVSEKLSGDWRQSIDAVTGDAGTGKGRAGFFRYGAPDVGGAELTGIEVWSRPQPVIKDTFSINKQFAYDFAGPTYPYPFTNSGGEKSEGNKTRYIFVLGEDLPHRRSDRIEIESLDEDVDYYLYELRSSYQKRGGPGKADTYWPDEGYKLVEQRVKSGKANYKPEADDDFLILEATLKPGVTPGYKALKINGVETAWLLRFGDHQATMGFARDLTLDLRDQVGLDQKQIPVEYEQTDLVYRQEQVVLEIRTQGHLPIEEFRILVGKNGQMMKFGDDRGLLAKRSSNPANPNIYHTAPIYLINKGEQNLYPPDAITIEVTARDKLQAALGGAQILNLQTPLVQAQVLGNPTEVLKAVQGGRARPGRLWREAVLRAAQCAGIEGAQSIATSEMSRLQADEYTDFNVSTIWRDVETLLQTRINIGEHAGSIMMRPMFIAMMKQSLAYYETELDDTAVMGLRRELESAVLYDRHALENVIILAPKGGSIALATTFYDTHMEREYGLSSAALATYQVKAMREARSALASALKKSIKKAEQTDECNVRDMLFLTGFGWQNVQRRTHATLMKLKNVREIFNDATGKTVIRQRANWVADRQARARVANVALYAQMLKRQEDLSDDEWDNFLITVSLLSLPIGIGAEFLAIESAVAGVALLDASDLIVNLYQESEKQVGEHVELEFARGASAVIGSSRFDKAVAQDSSIVISYFKTILSASQVANSIASLSSAARLERSVRRANRVVNRMYANKASVGDILPRLSASEKVDIFRAIMRTRSRRAALGPKGLDANELRISAFDRAFASRAHPPGAVDAAVRPTWATRLSEQAFNRLDDMIMRADVIRLVEAHPAEMNRLLMDDDALGILRLPQEDFQSFERAVRREKNRAPMRGNEVVDQADEALGNPEGLTYSKVRFDREGDYLTAETRVYAGRETNGTKYGWFIRGRKPDPVFNTGKDLFVFDLAQTFRHAPRATKPGRETGMVGYGAAPRWVYDVKVPLRDDDPGLPFVMFSNFRTYRALGFSFADPQLGGIMLKNVVSVNSVGELNWLRHTYPNKSVDELFQYTHSYRYAKNTAEQLGFRVTEVRVRGAVPGEPGYVYSAPLAQQVKSRFFDPGAAKNAGEVVEAQRRFVEKYEVPGHPDAPVSFDVYLKLEAQ
tara:strand:+ start:375745 stop:379671 length:3927 start_codon:yes stop_codon:yes gene_type:complete